MNYTVTSSIQQIDQVTGSPRTDAHGNHSFTVTLKDEQGQIYSLFMNKKPGNTVSVGQVLDGTLQSLTSAKGNQYFKFVPTPPMPTQTTIPTTGVLTTTQMPQTPSTFPNPREAEREYIIRQNALTNAVAYCTAKANLYAQDGTTKKSGVKVALEYLDGKKVLEVAHYFAKFSLGQVEVTKPSGSEVFTNRNSEEEPLPEPPVEVEEEI